MGSGGLRLYDARGRRLRDQLEARDAQLERDGAETHGLISVMQEDWGGGAYAEVLDDGDIAVGDEVGWTE